MLGIEGILVATVEDKHGNVRQRVEAKNRLTDAALRATLFNGIRHAQHHTMQAMGFDFAVATSQRVNFQIASPVQGIYAMNKEVDWSKIWVKPPYVKEDWVTLSDDVVFWNTGNQAFETENRMMRDITRAHIDGVSNSVVGSWVKSDGNTGTVKSIAIGNAHGDLTPWGVSYSEPLPTHFFTYQQVTATSQRPCAFEHLVDRTIIYYAGINVNTIFSFDLLTKHNQQITGNSLAQAGSVLVCTDDSNIRHSFGCTNAAAAQVTASAHNITLGHAVGAITTGLTQHTIVTPVGDVTLDTARGAVPIMVMRPDTKQVEIFLSLDYNGDGCRLIRGSWDVNGFSAANVEWTEMGRIPYVLGSVPPTGVATGVTYGYYDAVTGTYWLPCASVIDPNGTMRRFGNSTWYPGVKMRFGTPGAGGTIVGEYIASQNGVTSIFDVIKSSYGVHQGRFRVENNNAQIATWAEYRSEMGNLFSAVNLPTPITRNEDETLRLTYTYQLRNA